MRAGRSRVPIISGARPMGTGCGLDVCVSVPSLPLRTVSPGPRPVLCHHGFHVQTQGRAAPLKNTNAPLIIVSDRAFIAANTSLEQWCVAVVCVPHLWWNGTNGRRYRTV